MQYVILCIGKIKDSFYRNLIDDYCNEVRRRQHQLLIYEFPDEKIPNRLSDKMKDGILQKEGAKLLSNITARDYVLALCIEGVEVTTSQHKQIIDEAYKNGYERIVYVIGGSLGLWEQIKQRANKKLSFSKMTFPHQLMRMVLCEEITNIV